VKACVFVGPTVPLAEARRELDAAFLPPARQGDLYEAVSLLRPRAVGIVDGHFQWTPAVWHKEILWAMRQGVQVFGAASMGALRAAELEAFGMRGVGRVFEAYRDGCLAEEGGTAFEDDDEVAVVHGPAELGYPLLSEAMINIRLTLVQAARDGVIAAATGACLRRIAKSTFFAERSYPSLLAEARVQRLAETELRAFERWLPSGGIDQKRADALAMLRAMRAWLSSDRPSSPPSFHFEPTCYWQLVVANFEARPEWVAEDVLTLAELRLDSCAWRATLDRVLVRLAGPEEQSVPVGTQAQLAAARLRRSRAALLDQLPLAAIERLMLEEIKADGILERLRKRAEEKRRCLAGLATSSGVDSLSDHQRLELTDWYFTNLVGSEIPDDLGRWIKDAGYPDEDSFHAALFDEFRFRRATTQPAAAKPRPARSER
jgi:hypothetical protein